MAEEKTYLTEEGLKKLQDEYSNLVHVEREVVKAELKEARSLGDLSENADYDAAREKQAQLEHRISELEFMLKNYEIIDTKGDSKVVHIGSTVTLQFQDTKETATYRIVGRQEADPLEGLISNETPLAKAILEKKAGQISEVPAKKPYKVLIISVEQKSAKED
jgi:transcription elongation factor GreA